MKPLLTVFVYILSIQIAHCSFLDSDGILRDQNGKIKFLTFRQAQTACPKGTHLPSPREYAEELMKWGARGIKEWPVKTYYPSDFYQGYVFYNKRSGEDQFYFSRIGYRRPDGDLGKHEFWTSHYYSGSWARKYGTMLDAYFGRFHPSSVSGVLTAVRCFPSQIQKPTYKINYCLDKMGFVRNGTIEDGLCKGQLLQLTDLDAHQACEWFQKDLVSIEGLAELAKKHGAFGRNDKMVGEIISGRNRSPFAKDAAPYFYYSNAGFQGFSPELNELNIWSSTAGPWHNLMFMSGKDASFFSNGYKPKINYAAALCVDREKDFE